MSRTRSSAAILAATGVLAFLLVLPCGMKVRDGEGWVRSAVSAKEIGLALHNYYDMNGELPPAVVRDKDGRPLYNWGVAILPYIESDPSTGSSTATSRGTPGGRSAAWGDSLLGRLGHGGQHHPSFPTSAEMTATV